MSVFQLQNTFLSISVKTLGAELCSVRSNTTGIEYLWQADPTVWARHAPHLFPIVGKLKNNFFTHGAHAYQLPQHGFARDLEFKCITHTDEYLCFELVESERTLQHYPFRFNLRVNYQLTDNRLETSYLVSNPDENELYFSIGAHPAFNCPLEHHESFNDYELWFPDKSVLTCTTLHHGLITQNEYLIDLPSNRLQLTRTLFNQDALVCQHNQIQRVTFLSKKTGHGVELQCEHWPYFGIWTKKETERFICLEPWYGIADMEDATGHLAFKKGILVLAPKQSFNASFHCLFF